MRHTFPTIKHLSEPISSHNKIYLKYLEMLQCNSVRLCVCVLKEKGT